MSTRYILLNETVKETRFCGVFETREQAERLLEIIRVPGSNYVFSIKEITDEEFKSFVERLNQEVLQ